MKNITTGQLVDQLKVGQTAECVSSNIEDWLGSHVTAKQFSWNWTLQSGKTEEFFLSEEVKACKWRILSNNEEELKIEDNLIDPKEYSLVFVQKGMGRDWTLYQDGKEVAGLKSVDIAADIDYPTEHTLKFLTGATNGEI